MDFIINIFWAVVYLAISLGGSLLLVALIAMVFYVVYECLWNKIFSTDDESVNVCFSCAFIVFIIIAIYSGYVDEIIAEIKNIFA